MTDLKLTKRRVGTNGENAMFVLMFEKCQQPNKMPTMLQQNNVVKVIVKANLKSIQKP
jgi:hypothetical protein